MVLQFSLPLIIGAILGVAVVAGGVVLLTSSGTASVAGTWIGNVSGKDVGTPGCSFAGPALLTLTQSGAYVSGWLNGSITLMNSTPEGRNCADYASFNFIVYGGVNGTKITLLDNYNVNYTGAVNSDTMILRVNVSTNTSEQCVEYCRYTRIYILKRPSKIQPSTSSIVPTTTIQYATSTAYTTTIGSGSTVYPTTTIRYTTSTISSTTTGGSTVSTVPSTTTGSSTVSTVNTTTTVTIPSGAILYYGNLTTCSQSVFPGNPPECDDDGNVYIGIKNGIVFPEADYSLIYGKITNNIFSGYFINAFGNWTMAGTFANGALSAYTTPVPGTASNWSFTVYQIQQG
jgi:hypothetical protein